MSSYPDPRLLSRRRLLLRGSMGLGSAALAHLLERDGWAASPNPTAPRAPHFPPTATNVIYLFMSGGPSQLDLFDPKPELKRWHGQSLPPELTKNLTLAFTKPTSAVLASPRTFQKHGEAGIELSDFLPRLASCADNICLVRSMVTDAFNHDPGELLALTGGMISGRPSMGSWVVYGLGSESHDLPAFVVLRSGKGPSAGANVWSSGFLPSAFQGTPFRNQGDPVPYLSSPEGISNELQRARLDTIRDLNQLHHEQVEDDEIASRIATYELAFRMQTAAPELLDFSTEPESIRREYGIGEEHTNAFGVNCLLARRMVERGVRFVMLTHGDWDDHVKLDEGLAKNCRMTDQPVAALLRDLERNGLLDTTLVVWGGEFGRTPMGQINRSDEAAGRDHHPNAFSVWLAGGGVRAGQVYGKTDDFGLRVAENPVHVHDLQATILHTLGFDHEKFTFRHAGRDFRLTDVHGKVAHEILRSA
jgi:hypothetical protein